MSVIAIKKVSNPQKIIAEILLEFPCNSGCTLKVSKTHSRLQTPTFAANNAGAVSLKGIRLILEPLFFRLGLIRDVVATSPAEKRAY